MCVQALGTGFDKHVLARAGKIRAFKCRGVHERMLCDAAVQVTAGTCKLMVMAGMCEGDQGGTNFCKTVSLGAVQTLQPKVRSMTRASPAPLLPRQDALLDKGGKVKPRISLHRGVARSWVTAS